jgi:murein DD-endopeptidase MepM/ murein hydrolase activator NlpD
MLLLAPAAGAQSAAIGDAAPVGEAAPAGQAAAVGESAETRASGGTAPPGGSGGGSGETTSGGPMALRRVSVSPNKHVFGNGGRARFSWVMRSSRAVNVTVEVVRKSDGAIVKRFRRDGVRPGVGYRVGWAGIDSLEHRARVGMYYFRVRRLDNGRAVKPVSGSGARWFNLYWATFPVRGPHSYGDGIGAPRGDHLHQGQDISAGCGTPLVSAVAGRVQYSGYQAGGAGYYTVIDANRDGFDYVYMHLIKPAIHGTGERVKAGQRIGAVGTTGSSTGCHLHFEIWSPPGWYEGGNFINPMPKMRYWDTYS